MTERTTRPFFASFDGALNIAHRGARAYAPENTMPAFSKALDLCNADGVELDVHLTRDRKLVVQHDDDLTRCTNIADRFTPRHDSGRYFISDYTLDEIRSLDAGSWFVREYMKASGGGYSPETYLNLLSEEERKIYVTDEDLALYAAGGVKIPTLAEVLTLIKKRMARANVEIKNLPRLYEGIAEKVMALVHCMELTDRVLISSFDHEQLVKVRKLDDRVATAVLTRDRLAAPDRYLAALDADAYHPGCSGYDSLGFHSVAGTLDTTAIDACRGAGYGVNVWTCNDKEQMIQLIAAGVTGLVSDTPNRASDVSARR